MTQTLHDKDFELFISKQQIQTRIAELASAIQQDYHHKNPLFIAILNGAFVFAADLIRACDDLNIEICFTKLSSYKGMSSSGDVKSIIGLDTPIQNRHIIVVEDIVDTGRTLNLFLQLLENQQPASIALAACLLKPDALQFPIHVNYCGFEIPNRFVVGYGLDYDGLGRGLNDIYQLVT